MATQTKKELETNLLNLMMAGGSKAEIAEAQLLLSTKKSGKSNKPTAKAKRATKRLCAESTYSFSADNRNFMECGSAVVAVIASWESYSLHLNEIACTCGHRHTMINSWLVKFTKGEGCNKLVRYVPMTKKEFNKGCTVQLARTDNRVDVTYVEGCPTCSGLEINRQPDD